MLLRNGQGSRTDVWMDSRRPKLSQNGGRAGLSTESRSQAKSMAEPVTTQTSTEVQATKARPRVLDNAVWTGVTQPNHPKTKGALTDPVTTQTSTEVQATRDQPGRHDS